MTEKKVVFFDIDSTLYDYNKKIPESTAEAVSTLQKKGIITVIATGRAPFMFRDLREELAIHSYASFNGSYVVHEDIPVFTNPLPEAQLKVLVNESEKREYPLVFMNEQTMKANRPLTVKAETAIDTLKIGTLPAYDPNFYLGREIYQSLLFYSETDDDSSFLNREPLNKFRYVRWHEYSVDVIPQNGSKANGIRRLLDRLNLTPDQACAFGDGNNDVEMLDYVGTGVAMGNAVDRAKRAANFVTKPVDQDGIYFGLKEIGLI